jgi:EmrB/QacA subfamily drug resistance transporter
VLGLALAIIIIDTTLLNVSLSTIIREFKTTIQSIQWVITAYSLTLAALTITGGRIGDLFGRKRMFMTGAVIFAIGSLVASISHSVPVLLLGESIIEGIGAALMMPATASLLVANYQGRDRGIAFGVWGGIAGAASAIGPLLGGYLTNNYSWRWGFRINVVVVALLLLGSFLIRESRDTREKPKLDIPGVFLSAIGLLAIVFGFIESSTYGWFEAAQDITLFGHSFTIFGGSFVPFVIIIGVMFLNIFFLWEQRVEARGDTPLVSMKLLKNRTFTAGSLTTAIVTLGMVGIVFTLPVFLQAVLKLDALHTGLALLPLSLTMLVVAPISGILTNKFPAKYIILTGLIFDLIGMFVLRQSLSVSATTTTLIPGLILYGAGMGMVMAQISNLTLSAVAVQEAGEASGVSNTFRQVGSSLGSAVIGAVLLTSLTANITSGIQKSAVIPEQMKSQFVEIVSKQSSNVEFGGGAQLSTSVSSPIIKEIVTISNQSTVDSAKNAMVYAGFFILLAFIVAGVLLPNQAQKRTMGGPSAGH